MKLQKFRTLVNYSSKITFLVLFVVLANVKVGSSVASVANKADQRVTSLSLMAMQIEEDKKEDIYAPVATYTGDLTGYGANCPLCNGTLACRPSYYVKDGTDTYVDATYGKVRIVASSKNLACGSIVRFQSKLSENPIYAIVLDRGVLGTDLDLLTPSESYASLNVGRSKITYDVLREGWSRSNES